MVSVVMFASIDWMPGFKESGRIRNIDILERLKLRRRKEQKNHSFTFWIEEVVHKCGPRGWVSSQAEPLVGRSSSVLSTSTKKILVGGWMRLDGGVFIEHSMLLKILSHL